MKRNATAVWNGDIKSGNGHLTTGSETLKQTPYSFSSRFENGAGTNPEELIAAAHAGCFAMKLSYELQEAGFPATELHADCHIEFGIEGIKQSHIALSAKVANISDEKFAEFVKDAEENCPISVVLNTEIVVEYTLNG
ncbi:MAG: OsmC family peroxiredoxin [Bacteroidota bacterium]